MGAPNGPRYILLKYVKGPQSIGIIYVLGASGYVRGICVALCGVPSTRNGRMPRHTIALCHKGESIFRPLTFHPSASPPVAASARTARTFFAYSLKSYKRVLMQNLVPTNPPKVITNPRVGKVTIMQEKHYPRRRQGNRELKE